MIALKPFRRESLKKGIKYILSGYASKQAIEKYIKDNPSIDPNDKINCMSIGFTTDILTILICNHNPLISLNLLPSNLRELRYNCVNNELLNNLNILKSLKILNNNIIDERYLNEFPKISL